MMCNSFWIRASGTPATAHAVMAHMPSGGVSRPKAWVMTLSAVSLFLPADMGLIAGSAYLIGTMVGINLPCIAVWALFGSSLRGFLARRSRRVAFNVAMAVALVATGVIMVT